MNSIHVVIFYFFFDNASLQPHGRLGGLIYLKNALSVLLNSTIADIRRLGCSQSDWDLNQKIGGHKMEKCKWDVLGFETRISRLRLGSKIDSLKCYFKIDLNYFQIFAKNINND